MDRRDTLRLEKELLDRSMEMGLLFIISEY